MKEIIKDRVYCIKIKNKEKTFCTNVYYLKKEKILIDVGDDNFEEFIRLKKELSFINSSIKEIEYIIITHFHKDHIAMLNYFPNNITIIFDREYFNIDLNKVSENIDKKLNLYGLNDNVKREFKRNIISEIPVYLTKNKTYITCDDVTINNIILYSKSGHSSLDICIYLIDLSIMFTGDLLLEDIFFNSILDIKEERLNENLKLEYINTLTWLKEMGNMILAPGHGELICDSSKSIELKLKKMTKYINRAKRRFPKSNIVELSECLQFIFTGFRNNINN